MPAHGERLRIERGENDLLYSEEGACYIDLFCGGGAVILGHANKEISRHVKKQIERVWTTGLLPTTVRIEAAALVEGLVPDRYFMAGFYSTGMEVAEFALRVARVVTGKEGVIGFDTCMHGKSMAMSCLGWHNPLIAIDDFYRMPSFATAEEKALEQLDSVLRKKPVAAVYIEPMLGSAGGHTPSKEFLQDVSRMCADHGALLVFDEILTGFYRTGEPFAFQAFEVSPDIVLIGKAMGNGFPVSGILLSKKYALRPSMLPNSTFSGNSLAAAAVCATLREMRRRDMTKAINDIEQTVMENLKHVERYGIPLRGRGALWVLEFPSTTDTSRVAGALLRNGVIVSPARHYIRLLPPATVEKEHLVHACSIIGDACRTLSS